MNPSVKRKNIRLRDYDYSQPGYYYVTICAKNKQKIFGKIIDSSRDGALPHPVVELTRIGQILFNQWYELNNRYHNIAVEDLIIMPNHIHGIIIIKDREEQSPSPTLGSIVGTYKSITTKIANRGDNLSGRIIWQGSYYDHIIRNEKELTAIRKYIEDNPAKWQEDHYYI